MAKKVVSVALHKKSPIKQSNKRKKLKTALKKIFNYMKSDTYMFAPLIHPQPYNLTSAPASFRGVEPIKKKETKFLQDVNDYLKSDCYMYASLAMDSALDSASLHIGDIYTCRGKAETGSVSNQIKPRTDVNSARDIEDDDSYNPLRRIVVKHNILQRETIKHIVHQNCHSSSVPGKVLSQKEHRKIVVE